MMRMRMLAMNAATMLHGRYIIVQLIVAVEGSIQIWIALVPN